MKKNKTLRAAGILFLATMLTTCMTAGTFAKYTTSDSANDSARVAKFGVTVTADGSLFGEEYASKEGGATSLSTLVATQTQVPYRFLLKEKMLLLLVLKMILV